MLLKIKKHVKKSVKSVKSDVPGHSAFIDAFTLPKGEKGPLDESKHQAFLILVNQQYAS